jgi:hypothetical protein
MVVNATAGMEKAEMEKTMTNALIALALVLLATTVADAWKPVPNGAALDISYTEPSTNTDGTPLTDLAKIRIYWRCTAIGGGPACPANESIVDIPATRLQGGQVVVNNNSAITPVKCQQAATVTVQASALDNAVPPNESARTATASVTVNRAAEACPNPAPQIPTGIGVQ